MKEVKQLISEFLDKDVVMDSRLMGGMSNRTYIINLDDKLYTFRIPGKKADMFVDRVDEVKNLEVIDDLGIANHTVTLDVETGYKLAEYVDGKPLHELEDLHLEDVAAVLKKLHQSEKRFEKNYAPFQRLQYYETLNDDLKQAYFDTKSRLTVHQDYLCQLPKVMAHGDAQKSNFVIGDQTYLLDWEFAGNNDYYYDIACFGNVDFNDALRLLEVYEGHSPSQDEINRLTLWRTFQCLQWHNVALYKDKIGLSEELNIPFKAVADKYLNLANHLMDQIK